MLQKGRRHDADAAACNETARTSRGQAPLTHYTGQQTSVHSVHSVVKNDSVADLPRRGCEKFGRISPTKGTLKWQANAGIAAARATVVAASTVPTRSTSIATTKSTASGVVAQATGAVAYMLRTRCTGTVPAGTSASGAARRRMALAAYIRRLVAMRSRKS